MAEKNYIYIHLEIFVLPSEMENILPFKPRKPRNKCCRKVSKRQDFLRMYLERAFFPISSFVIIEKITSFCYEQSCWQTILLLVVGSSSSKMRSSLIKCTQLTNPDGLPMRGGPRQAAPQPC